MQKYYFSVNIIDFYFMEDEEIGFKYICDYIPITTPNNRRPGIKLEPSSITIHNTENPSSTANNERRWLTNLSNSRTASYHIVIDEHEAIEVLPLNEVAWHAGDGSKAEAGNRSSIGIEICESGNYELTLKHAVELVAHMLYERKWGVNRLKRHYDWSRKNCPRLMNQDGKWTGWTQFVVRVQDALKALNDAATGVKPEPTNPSVNPTNPERPSTSIQPKPGDTK